MIASHPITLTSFSQAFLTRIYTEKNTDSRLEVREDQILERLSGPEAPQQNPPNPRLHESEPVAIKLLHLVQRAASISPRLLIVPQEFSDVYLHASSRSFFPP